MTVAKIGEKTRSVYLVLIIVMIGILIRLPIGTIGSIDTTMLNDPDSFLYARKAIELTDKPMSEWSIFVDRSQDPLMNSIDSKHTTLITNFLPICIALLSRIFKGVSVYTIIYYFNAIVCPLSAIPAFIFVKKHTNLVGGIVSAMAIAIAPSYFFHTMSGYCDTDGLIMLLAVTLVLCQTETLFENSTKKKILLSLCSLVTTVIFYFTWEIYYFYVFISVGIVFIVVVLNKFMKLNLRVLPGCITELVLLMFCFAMSRENLLSHLKDSFIDKSNWPDESNFIGELEKPSFMMGGLDSSFFINQTGIVNWLGGLPLVVVLLCVVAFAIKHIISKNAPISRNDKCAYLILISFIAWACVTLVIVPTGIRFVQLLALPVCLILGIGIGLFYNEFSSRPFHTSMAKDLLVILLSIALFGTLMIINIYVAIIGSIIFLIFGILNGSLSKKALFILSLVIMFACPLFNEYKVTKNASRFVDDDFVEAAEFIKTNTDENSALVSWWNNGYYLEYASGRQTVADGGIYNGMYFYWLSNLFTSDDESLSVGICRMLQTGSLEAVSIVNECFKDEKTTSEILKEILVLDENSAAKVLVDKYNFSESVAKSIVENIFDNENNDIYLLMYDGLKGIVGAIGYYGLWDFEEERFFTVKSDSNGENYIYPDELKDSLIVRYLNGEKFDLFEEVFSNDTVTLYKVCY